MEYNQDMIRLEGAAGQVHRTRLEYAVSCLGNLQREKELTERKLLFCVV